MERWAGTDSCGSVPAQRSEGGGRGWYRRSVPARPTTLGSLRVLNVCDFENRTNIYKIFSPRVPWGGGFFVIKINMKKVVIVASPLLM